MRRIQKGAAPAALKPLEKDKAANWERVDGVTRQQLREALFAEQHGLCAYCLSRLNDPRLRPDPAPGRGGMKIEHFEARNEAGIPEDERHRRCFEWSNLLGVCPGGEDAPAERRVDGLYCEAARGNIPLAFNPARFPPDVGELLRATDRGELTPAKTATAPDRQRLNAQLSALRLNVPRLKESRMAAIEGARRALKRQGFTAPSLRRLLARTRAPQAGLLEPQCVWVEQYLQKKLR
jgi:uncharacterized protein (TIGR02646 family)